MRLWALTLSLLVLQAASCIFTVDAFRSRGRGLILQSPRASVALLAASASAESNSGGQANAAKVENASTSIGTGAELATARSTQQLRTLIESMPLDEKYSLLLQSYATNIMERTLSAADSEATMKTMESLYAEMLAQAVSPPDKASRAMLDAAAVLCDTEQLSRVLQLTKAAGKLRVFGVAVGSLTTPATSATTGAFADMVIPFDNREEEVVLATAVVTTVVTYLSLQLLGHTAVHEASAWGTLLGVLSLGVGAADVFFRSSKGGQGGCCRH